MRNATNNAFSEFEVVYQPIVDVTRESNPCVGAEALIRWNSGELGLIAPTDFIPLAEYLGLINPIGPRGGVQAVQILERYGASGLQGKCQSLRGAAAAE